MDFVFNRAGRINWIFSFGRSPDESAQTPIASGEGEPNYNLFRQLMCTMNMYAYKYLKGKLIFRRRRIEFSHFHPGSEKE